MYIRNPMYRKVWDSTATKDEYYDMIKAFCRRCMAFHDHFFMKRLRDINETKFKIMQLSSLPGAIFQWASINRIKPQFTYPTLSIHPTVEEATMNREAAEAEKVVIKEKQSMALVKGTLVPKK